MHGISHTFFNNDIALEFWHVFVKKTLSIDHGCANIFVLSLFSSVRLITFKLKQATRKKKFGNKQKTKKIKNKINKRENERKQENKRDRVCARCT
jgi:hypothetical protein